MKDSERTKTQIEHDEAVLIDRAIDRNLIRQREEAKARIDSYNRSLKGN